MCMYSQKVCYQYWPSSGYKQYGEYSVDLLGEEELEGHILRRLNITHLKVQLGNESDGSYIVKTTVDQEIFAVENFSPVA